MTETKSKLTETVASVTARDHAALRDVSRYSHFPRRSRMDGQPNTRMTRSLSGSPNGTGTICGLLRPGDVGACGMAVFGSRMRL